MMREIKRLDQTRQPLQKTELTPGAKSLDPQPDFLLSPCSPCQHDLHDLPLQVCFLVSKVGGIQCLRHLTGMCKKSEAAHRKCLGRSNVAMPSFLRLAFLHLHNWNENVDL